MDSESSQGQDGLRQRGQVPELQPASPPVAVGPDDSSHRKNRNRTLCRRLMLSKPYKLTILAVMSIVPVYGNLIAMPRLLDSRGCEGLCRLRHFCFTLWVSVLFLYNFCMTQFTDPGGCAVVRPTQEVTGQYELSLACLEGSKMEGVEDTGLTSLLYAPSWCELCQHWKAPRSHHCSICQRCVLRMDHHCPITGNCIGIRNHGHFVLMYFFAFIGLSYSMSICSVVVLSSHWKKLLSNKEMEDMVQQTRFLVGFMGVLLKVVVKIAIATGLEIAAQMVFTGIALIAVLSCGVPALHLVCSGTTVLEVHFPMKEYVQIKPQVYCPLLPGFYSRGWRQNLRDLLGARWWLRLLLPTRGGPVDLRPAIAPQPSRIGAASLVQRVTQVEEQGVTRQVRNCQELGINPGPGASQ